MSGGRRMHAQEPIGGSGDSEDVCGRGPGVLRRQVVHGFHQKAAIAGKWDSTVVSG
jgi:hypothetical protein